MGRPTDYQAQIHYLVDLNKLASGQSLELHKMYGDMIKTLAYRIESLENELESLAIKGSVCLSCKAIKTNDE